MISNKFDILTPASNSGIYSGMTVLSGRIDTLSGNIDAISGTMDSGFNIISGQVFNIQSGLNDTNSGLNDLSGYINLVSGYASGEIQNVSGYADNISGYIYNISGLIQPVPSDLTLNSLVIATSGYSGLITTYSTTDIYSGSLMFNSLNGGLNEMFIGSLKVVESISGLQDYTGQLSGYIDNVSGIEPISGYSGYSGWSGISGQNGSQGLSGYSGKSGYSGTNGTNGSQGLSGYSGLNGVDGASGISGYSGWSGQSGWSGINGASTQTILYFNHSNSDISTYESLTVAPASGVQVDEVTTLTNTNTEYLIDAYATASGYPNTTLLLAGLWQFSTYNYLGSTGGTTKIYSRVYKRTSSGVETEIFTTSGNAVTITGQTVANYSQNYTTTTDTLLDPADRLIVKLYGTSTQAGKDLHFVYDGNINNSRVYTPITSRISTDLIWTYISGMSGNTFFLNQSNPQFVVSGTPVFRSGLDVGSSGSGSNLTTYATLGSELAPAFSDASWNYQTSWSQLSGVITKVSGAGIAYNYSFLPTIGQTYKIVVNVPTWTGTGNLAVNLGSYVNGTNNGYISGSGTWTFYQTAYSTTGFQLVPSINNVQCTINSISVKKLTDNTGDLKVAGDIYVGSSIKSFGGSADAIFIGANGNVGIKNSQPVYPLDVVGNARCSTQLVQEGTTNTILLDTNSFYGRNIQLASNYTLAWSNTNAVGATMDTGISRVAAGIVGIGSGNQGGVGGTLQVTTISGAGVINFGKYYVSGVSGWTGSFSTSGGQTVSVLNGIITGVA